MKALDSVKKADIALVLMLGIIISVIWLWNGYHENKQTLVAEIVRNGQVVGKIDLNKIETQEYINLTDGIKMTILAEKGRIRVLQSECPNQICVNTGWLTKPGDVAICAPGDTIVIIDVPD